MSDLDQNASPASLRRTIGFVAATWFGSGNLPWAPGTWGSLAALPFAWAILWFGNPTVLLGATAVVFAVGWWASIVYMNETGKSDPDPVVIDEVAGQWLALLPAAAGIWWHWLVGFLLFRLFDIVKPWPVGWADRRVKGGLGVMLDDILAAVYAGLTLYVIIVATGGTPGVL